MNYLALDMEFNQFYHKGMTHQEVIEIGITEISDEGISYFHSHIRPYNKLNKKISQLTGINEGMLRKSPLFNTFMHRLFKDLSNNEYILVTWSDSDIRVLVNQLLKHKLTTKWIKGYIDLQEVIVTLKGLKKSPKLKNAMEIYNIDWVGKEHRANYDAFNTARLFFAVKDLTEMNSFVRYDFLDINIIRAGKGNKTILTRSIEKIFEEIIQQVYESDGNVSWAKILMNERFRNLLYLKNINLDHLSIFEDYFHKYQDKLLKETKK